MTVNKAILVGRLARDPEVRYSQSAEPVAIARYTLAVNRRFKRQGEADADFIDCVVFGKGAEFAERYLKKGMQIAVSGRIQVRTWEDQQGNRRWSTEVVVEDQEFTESRASFESRQQRGGDYHGEQPSYGSPSAYNSEPPAQRPPDNFDPIAETVDDDDLPF